VYLVSAFPSPERESADLLRKQARGPSQPGFLLLVALSICFFWASPVAFSQQDGNDRVIAGSHERAAVTSRAPESEDFSMRCRHPERVGNRSPASCVVHATVKAETKRRIKAAAEAELITPSAWLRRVAIRRWHPNRHGGRQ